jgi:tetratricopeptide (TPR) repeat protein
MTTRMRTGVSAALIAMLGIICYANSLRNGFVWDDTAYIVTNRLLRSWWFVPRFFTTDAAETYQANASPVPIYRPLALLSYLIDYQLWGPNPAMFHLTNVIWHIVSAVLVYLVFCALGIQWRWSLLAALLFVCHPIQVENVAFVAGRNAILCTVGLLGSLLLLLKWRERSASVAANWMLAGSLVTFALALQAKEVAASFPLIVMAVLLMVPSQSLKFSRRQAAVVVGLYGMVLVIYLIVRVVVLPEPFYPERFSLLKRGELAVESWAFTVGLALMPVNLHHERNLPISGAPAVGLTCAGALALSVMTLAAWRWRSCRGMAFGLAFALAAFLPTSNLAPLNYTFGERWISWPLVGFLAAAASVTELVCVRRPKIEPGIWLLSAAIISVFSALTIAQNRVWYDDVTLFRTLIARGADTVRVRLNFATALIDAKRYDDAREQLQIALKTNPRNGAAIRGLGILTAREGDERGAQTFFDQALALDPSNNVAAIWLSALQERLGEMGRAEHTLQIAADHEKTFAARLKLATLYGKSGKLDEAETLLRTILEADPLHAAAHNALGTVLVRDGKLDQAEKQFHLALRYDRWMADAHANLAAVANARGDIVATLAHYNDALGLSPSNADLYLALGITLRRAGDGMAAQRAFARAFELDPELTNAAGAR